MKDDAQPIDLVLSALGVQRTEAIQYTVHCPAHNDESPSLAINVKPDGTVGLYCLATCETEAVCAALKLTMADLFPKKGKAATKPSAKSRKTAKRTGKAPKPITEADHAEAWEAARKLAGRSILGFKLTHIYPYRDKGGNVWGWRARSESATGKKEIKPFHFDGKEWVMKEAPAPRKGKPLYRLPEILATDGPIYIVEGEKCADALAALGIAATTSGAAKSAGKADWSLIAGRPCIIWADNDDPGDQYAADVAKILGGIGCPVSIIDVDALDVQNEGDDAADWLIANPDATAADVLALPVTSAGASSHSVNLVRASDIKPKAVDWLWEPWLARGMLALLAGNGGTGKTTIALTFAAAVSTGGKLPDGSNAAQGSVLIWTGEDAIAEVLVPRLIEAGADLSRIHFVESMGDGNVFDPATDMAALEQQVQRIGNVALVIVDPIVSAVSGDSHKNAEVRRGLQPLMTLAMNTGAAVLGITHYAKNTAGRSTTERVIGSVAFSAVARVVLATAMGADGEGRIVRSKSNLGPTGDGFTYSIAVAQRDFDGKPSPVSRIAWGTPIYGQADQLLADLEGKRNPKDEAAEWLTAALHAGPVASKELMAKAEADGIAWRTIQRAKEALNVVVERNGGKGKARGDGGWFWRLPASAREAAQVLRKYQ